MPCCLYIYVHVHILGSCMFFHTFMLLSTICPFVSTQRILFSNSCKCDLVVRIALAFVYRGRPFFLLHFWRTGACQIMCSWQSAAFRTLSTSPPSLWACHVSAEKSATNLERPPQHEMSHFLTLSSFPLCFWLWTNVSLGVESPLGVFLASSFVLN